MGLSAARRRGVRPPPQGDSGAGDSPPDAARGEGPLRGAGSRVARSGGLLRDAGPAARLDSRP